MGKGDDQRGTQLGIDEAAECHACLAQSDVISKQQTTCGKPHARGESLVLTGRELQIKFLVAAFSAQEPVYKAHAFPVLGGTFFEEMLGRSHVHGVTLKKNL